MHADSYQVRVDDAEVELHDYPRFDNPYCQAAFGARNYSIRHGDQVYQLDVDDQATTPEQKGNGG